MCSAFETLRGRDEGARGGVARLLRSSEGQSSVEAAFAIPILMILLLLLLQPGIILYDRVVMQGAAAETCRLMSTLPPEDAEKLAEDYLRRRLGAVPQHDLFHVHSGGCSWSFELSGNETTSEVAVAITTEVKPLPLLDIGASLLGLVNGRGNLKVTVESRARTQPSWVEENGFGMDPPRWIGSWQ